MKVSEGVRSVQSLAAVKKKRVMTNRMVKKKMEMGTWDQALVVEGS